MKLFKSHEPNTFHYVTCVTYRRIPIFRSDSAANLLIEALVETKKRSRMKLIGYVVMPDHTHLILNPLDCDISKLMNSIKSASARSIIDWLIHNHHHQSLSKLELAVAQKRSHTHAVWQKGFSSIDLWSPKFVRQKLDYIHANPVRAGLCEHPAKWKWSSYRAYLPHDPGGVPIEMDWRGYWSKDEFESQDGGETAGGARL
jgi:REP element-mobilizing transposase RayT